MRRPRSRLAGRNNPLNQPPYTLDGRRGRQKLRTNRLHGRRDERLQLRFRTVYDLRRAALPYQGLYAAPGDTSYMANLPTDQLNVLPASIHFILTVHE